ncbi:GntR family transcriptional regulator [Burkholderia sp. 22PA0106]|uniref:GntR family transcriptional regulator n=1 Tax=Burkholderia sp. 22PA0106 TaxID=3237371 RepID=UPI0039C10475
MKNAHRHGKAGEMALNQQVGVYEQIRDDIIAGHLQSSQRLKVGDLAAQYGVSTNPIREALQQLRGEGLVLIEANRGARVRTVDEDFVRDIMEVRMLVEPAMTRWFVSIVDFADINQLEAVQAEIERLNFGDLARHGRLDTKFHDIIYARHYNRLAAEVCRHRELLRAISRRYPSSLSRREAVIRDHRELIERIRAQDADGAAEVVARHIEGGGRHLIEQMSLAKRMAG